MKTMKMNLFWSSFVSFSTTLLALEGTVQLEQIQHSAALAVTRARRGTSRQRLFEELGWETLYQRCWYRRMCHVFSLTKTKSPGYLFLEIPD